MNRKRRHLIRFVIPRNRKRIIFLPFSNSLRERLVLVGKGHPRELCVVHIPSPFLHSVEISIGLVSIGALQVERGVLEVPQFLDRVRTQVPWSRHPTKQDKGR